MLSYIPFPAWIRPEIIPGLPLRWYGLMYIFAFLTAYFLFVRQVREKKLDISSDTSTNLFFWCIIGLLIGARVFSALFYDRTGKYWLNPLLIFWPFDSDFNFTGLQGMSYHGGLIGVIAGCVLYCRKNRLNTAEIGDMLAAAAPLGYTFGRLGNFINGELYGRVTAVPWGMVFPRARSFPLNQEWVTETAEKAGMDIFAASGFINLPRHPSQLYEALFEGIILWAALWFFFRRKKLAHGSIIGLYTAGYGLVRFFIEYFREPDSDLGFILQLSSRDASIHRLDSFLNFTMGQVLCLLMIIGGLGFTWYVNRKEKSSAGGRVSVSGKHMLKTGKKKHRRR